MLLYRALNDTDFHINAKENGLYSKINVSEALRKVLDFTLFVDDIYMTDQEYDEAFNKLRNNDMNYIVNNIKQNAYAKEDRIKSLLNKIMYYKEIKNYDVLNKYLKSFMDIMASRNAHMLNGSREDYEWISFSKDLDVFKKYYLLQKKHLGVCIESNIDIIFDGDLIAFDMSSKEAMLNNPFIINKSVDDDKKTDINSRAIKYSINDSEILYYNYIPKERLFFLDPLQVDMLYNGMTDTSYFSKAEMVRKYRDDFISDWLWEKLEKYPRVYKMVYDELYIKKKAASEVSRIYGIDYQKILDIKEEILNLLNTFDEDGYLVLNTKDKIKVIER